ncbi:NAD-dependent epimerase/dehydratase family protein [Litorihabitans aurantiacus]|nr:NAD-dependent epimerase/dehydratase family protein [Litorihabitans aurantiacus]
MTTASRSEQPRPVLVTGATGKIGRRIARRLEAAGHTVRAASRSSATRLDWADPATIAPALDGVALAHLTLPDEPIDLVPVTRALAAADLERVVLLSARNPEQGGDGFVPAVEEAVAASGVPTVVLRPSWFVQNFTEGMFAQELAGGSLALPVGEGLEPFIDAEDIAEVAVAALLTPEHVGRTYELTGPELMTFADAVALVGEATSRELTFTPADPTAWAREAAAEVGDDGARLQSNLYAAIARGENASVTSGVQDVLGRAPRTVREALAG